VKKIACLILGLFMLAVCGAYGQETPYIDALRPVDAKDITESTHFKLVRNITYPDMFLAVRIEDNKTVGYAQWDRINRRWTLFNLHGDYRGFIQATIGQQLIKHERNDIWYQYYTQYLFYFKDNVYRGVMIAAVGGRPTTETLPYGELGGGLNLYSIGNIPLSPPKIWLGIDVANRPLGIDISIVYRIPTWK
jgi:hypothetical protein